MLVMGVLVSSVAAYEAIVVADGGVLTGSVTFAGIPPTMEPLRVTRNREVCGETKESQALVLGPGGGVAGSVVLIEGITRGKEPDGNLVVDNHNCLFVPHVSAAMVGVRAWVKNSDPVLHSTHGLLGASFASRTTLFNLALPIPGQAIEITRKLGRLGPVRLLCENHPHMLAWLYMHDSPYIAVTDEKGAFRIGAIPPGRYRVTMWHEPFRPRRIDSTGRPVYDAPYSVTREVTIGARATTRLELELR
jgi:hypothetical protein